MKRSALCEQVIHLAQQGYSVATIVKSTGSPVFQVRNCVGQWRRTLKVRGEPMPPCRCGLPGNHRDLCDEKPLGGIPRQPPPSDFEVRSCCSSIESLKKYYRVGGRKLRRWFAEKGITVAHRGFGRPPPPTNRIEELAAKGWSVSTIALDLDESQRRVKRVVRNWRDGLRSRGKSLPPCRCGAPHDHSFFCSEKIYGEGIGHRARRQAPEDFELVAPYLSTQRLARHYRTGHSVINRWHSEFPWLPRPTTTARPLRPAYRATSGIRDPIFNLIERCVPNSYAPDVRADIISTINLALLDGSLSADRLMVDGRSVLNRAAKECGIMSRSTVSLDEEMGEGGPQFIDLIEDEDALIAFDRIFEDDDWSCGPDR